MMKSALLFLSELEAPKQLLTSVGVFNKMTRRFVAGETLDEAAAAIKVLNALGIKATFDQEDARPTSKVYPLVSDVAAEELPDRGLTNLLVELFYCKGTDSRLQSAGQL